MAKQYVGAVAVSWYRTSYTINAINMLTRAGVKTNIHYILGKNTIEEAIDRLKNDTFPEGINAIIFLLHKSKGMGTLENTLVHSNNHVRHFFELVDKKSFSYKIGFDSCSCAGIINFTDNIDLNSIDYCESTRFSCYIDAQMNMMPCSFALDDKNWQVNLNNYSIEEVWNSDVFDRFRKYLIDSCKSCKYKQFCCGGCSLLPEITLCTKSERTYHVNVA